MSDDQMRTARARLAALTRHHGPDSYYTRQARRDLRFVQLAGEIMEAMTAEPPLTLEQTRELRTILVGRGAWKWANLDQMVAIAEEANMYELTGEPVRTR